MTSAYQYVNRGGNFVQVEVEKMTNEERMAVFGGYHPANIINWLNVVCTALNEAEETIKCLKERKAI